MTEQTLRTAMAEYGDTVYRLALCRTQSIPDAEDVYQDVFLALLRQQAEGWEAGRMKAWLIRTTLNRCTDLHRFRLRRPVLPLDEALTCPVDEAAAELWEAVGVLPEKLRTAVHPACPGQRETEIRIRRYGRCRTTSTGSCFKSSTSRRS